MTMDHEARARITKLEGQVTDLLKRILALEAKAWPDPDRFTDPEDDGEF